MTILYDFGMLMLLSLIVIIFIIIVIVTNICVIVYQQQWFLISYLATLYKLSNKINICYIFIPRNEFISQRTSWYCKGSLSRWTQGYRSELPAAPRPLLSSGLGRTKDLLEVLTVHPKLLSPAIPLLSPILTNRNDPSLSALRSVLQKSLSKKYHTCQFSENPPPPRSRAWWRGRRGDRWWSGCSWSWPSRPPCRRRTSLSGCCTGCSQRMASRLDMIMTGLYTALWEIKWDQADIHLRC